MIFKKVKKTKAEYWNDGTIPSNLFFYNLNNEDLSFLIKKGNPTPEELQNAWSGIQDEYFRLKNSRKATIMMNTRDKVALLILKINTCKLILNVAIKNNLTDDQFSVLFSNLSKLKIKIDNNKPLEEQFTMIIDQYIPSWETELEIEKENLKIQSNQATSSFEEVIESFSDAKERHVPENISLRRFIAVEKSAKKNSQ
jgi:hypothetical protein